MDTRPIRVTASPRPFPFTVASGETFDLIPTTIIKPTPGDRWPELSVEVPLTFEVARVLYDDEIWERITDDHCPPREQFPVPPLHYLGGYVDGTIVALYSLHTDTARHEGWRMHFMVLKAHRRLASLFIAAFLELSPRPLYVVIPKCYRSVINFAGKWGFDLYAIDLNAYRKGGRSFDNWNMVLR